MEKVSIQEIAKVLVVRNGLTNQEALQFVKAMFEVIQEGLELEQQVKVKGLGTFKIVGVEARESVSVNTGERVVIDSHAKITFTPDSTMKELVNKPFSQFETVVLNDGVEFEDMPQVRASETFPEEPVSIASSLETPYYQPTQQEEGFIRAEEVSPIIAEEPKEVFIGQPNSSPDIEPITDTAIEQENPMKAQPQTEEQYEQIPKSEEQDEDIFIEEPTKRKSWWWLFGILSLLLIALGTYGGYRYGRYTAQLELLPIDTVTIEASSSMPNLQHADSVETEAADTIDVATGVEEEQEPMQIEPKSEPPSTQAHPTPTEDTQADAYEAKDIRIRTGAWRIVGLAHEIKVRAGDNIHKISKRELGEGMECYIEVFNELPVNPELKEGQVLKIPKVELKKKRKS